MEYTIFQPEVIGKHSKIWGLLMIYSISTYIVELSPYKQEFLRKRGYFMKNNYCTDTNYISENTYTTFMKICLCGLEVMTNFIHLQI